MVASLTHFIQIWYAIFFCNSFDKFVDKNNQIIPNHVYGGFPQKVCFLGPQGVILGNNPFILFNMVGQFTKVVSPFVTFGLFRLVYVAVYKFLVRFDMLKFRWDGNSLLSHQRAECCPFNIKICQRLESHYDNVTPNLKEIYNHHLHYAT